MKSEHPPAPDPAIVLGAEGDAAPLGTYRRMEMGYAPLPLDAAEVAQIAAEREVEDARYQSEREREYLAQARGTALQLAAAVCGGSGDSGAVLDAARDFAAFLTGAEQKAH